MARASNSVRVAPVPTERDEQVSHISRLSTEARQALLAGLESARTKPLVDRGSFAQYACEDDDSAS